jgi:hypothetical protein
MYGSLCARVSLKFLELLVSAVADDVKHFFCRMELIQEQFTQSCILLEDRVLCTVVYCCMQIAGPRHQRGNQGARSDDRFTYWLVADDDKVEYSTRGCQCDHNT